MPNTQAPSIEEKPAGKPQKLRIHTMPDKFYLEDHGSGSGKNNFWLVLLIVLAVVLIGGGVVLAKKYMNRPANTNDDNVNVVDTENSNSNTASVNTANTNRININGSTNQNSNTGGNTNQLPSNINGLFGNSNTNTPTNAISNINTVVPSSQDSDLDGLTDVEEALFGTSVSVSDTDGDGFADGQEVLSGYDPTGPGQLESSTKVQQYTNTQTSYLVLYPTAWIVADDPENPQGKLFTTSGEFVGISIQDNPARLTARDWYVTQSPGIDSSRIVAVTNWDKTLSGVLSLNGLTAYYAKGDKVYIIAYNTNVLTQANYKTTFAMMYKSFRIIESTTNTNAVNNTNSVANVNTNRNSNANRNTNAATNANSNRNTNSNSNTSPTNHL